MNTDFIPAAVLVVIIATGCNQNRDVDPLQSQGGPPADARSEYSASSKTGAPPPFRPDGTIDENRKKPGVQKENR